MPEVTGCATMVLPIKPAARGRVGIHCQPRRHIMKWETPSACDMRFGFEINLYVSVR